MYDGPTKQGQWKPNSNKKKVVISKPTNFKPTGSSISKPKKTAKQVMKEIGESDLRKIYSKKK